MTCASCGSLGVVCVDADEPRDTGTFIERYECEVCGVTGHITGDEEQPPNEWSRYGQVFQ